MSLLESNHTHCPYCGEAIELLVDCSILQQQYIEDCFVCCRPILVDIFVDNDGQPCVVVKDENEA
ncbi:MAG: CPXCG motif-containing cysteine-rich protein [Gammaproteobacteria bacterium]|nr:MAG: CPXCG motif-containing cysteine-rich protein [Gammaproteobacteria bacterium]